MSTFESQLTKETTQEPSGHSQPLFPLHLSFPPTTIGVGVGIEVEVEVGVGVEGGVVRFGLGVDSEVRGGRSVFESEGSITTRVEDGLGVGSEVGVPV